jgi:CBS domain containing-hemolysin-like protein
LDSDSRGRKRPLILGLPHLLRTAAWIGIIALAVGHFAQDAPIADTPEGLVAAVPGDGVPWHAVVTPGVMTVTGLMLALSAFFSASEIAFFSLHKLELRALSSSGNVLDQLVVRLMRHPGDLLTSILMGNSIVNVSIGVVLAGPTEQFFERVLLYPPPASYAAAVAVTTIVLVFFGEILPKVVVVRQSQAYARLASPAILLVDLGMRPLRNSVLFFIGAVFRVTRFSEVRPAPFMTDDEFMSLLSDSEASGVIQTDERQMIQGIIEFSDLMVREILVPRPDVIALPQSATMREALALFRKEQCARMPVYQDDLDHIAGILYAKDLLPKIAQGQLDEPIAPLLRKARYVPETMTIADFMKMAQRTRAHMAVVVDEYGGTEGIVTLQDALGTVIGDIDDEDEDHEYCHDLGGGAFRVDGAFSLSDLEELTGIFAQDDEHTTLAGFLMAKSDKVLDVGDEIEHEGILFRVERMDGRRVVKVRFQVPQPAAGEVQP